MSFSFIVVAIMTIIFLAFSLLLLIVPKKIVCGIRCRCFTGELKDLWRYRVGGLVGIGLCAFVAGLYLVPHGGTEDIKGHFYFSKYIKNRPSPQADIYAIKAFNAWRFMGNVKSFVEAAEELTMDSPVWKDYFRLAGDGYKRRGRYEQYGPFLHILEEKINHPVGRMALFFELGEWYRLRDVDRAREYFYKVIDINADPFLMDQASSNLHAMDVLNLGQNAPDFNLKDINGKQYSLDSLRGRVVILQFWSVSCPGCREEMPMYKKIFTENQSDKLVMLGVTMKDGEKTYEYIEKEKLEWPQVVLDQKDNPMIQQSYSIQYVPNNYVIGVDGKIVAKQLKPKELEAKIKNLLKLL